MTPTTETLRRLLNYSGEILGVGHEVTIAISERLDALIVDEMRGEEERRKPA